jgi:catechol 2,3-dioxygenase-like lactoylglutathione lyase family enzyme
VADFRTDNARCIPVLASLNIDESHDFYVHLLGFSAVVYRAHNYLIVRRDEMEFHFWLADDRIHPEHTSCYIRGGQVVALYEEYSRRGVPQLSSFEVRPWNMKEFYIFDPHGNLPRFGCAPGELEESEPARTE